uniref:Uncharacterized protein n=1 Tax=Ascaris lumbricoides TaxID=6252 RepID=A0A0M3HEU7_ASCLU
MELSDPAASCDRSESLDFSPISVAPGHSVVPSTNDLPAEDEHTPRNPTRTLDRGDKRGDSQSRNQIFSSSGGLLNIFKEVRCCDIFVSNSDRGILMTF